MDGMPSNNHRLSRSSSVPALRSRSSVADLIYLDDHSPRVFRNNNSNKYVASKCKNLRSWKSILRLSNTEKILPNVRKNERFPTIQDILRDGISFITNPGQPNTVYQCVIVCDRSRGIQPVYLLYLEHIDSPDTKVLLLGARKRLTSLKANYSISTEVTRTGIDDRHIIAKVKCNSSRTEFTIYDNGKHPKKWFDRRPVRREFAAVVYEPSYLGLFESDIMTTILPGLVLNVENEAERIDPQKMMVQPHSRSETLLEKYKSEYISDLTVMDNEQPFWNEFTQMPELEFHGRVTQMSDKNFKILHEEDPDYIVLLFGSIGNDRYSMDFRYPLSAVQAFGIALSSIHKHRSGSNISQ